MPLIQRFQFQA